MYFSKYLNIKFPKLFMGYAGNPGVAMRGIKSFWFIFGRNNFVQLVIDKKLNNMKMGKYLYNENFKNDKLS